ncbi:homocysteine S-methyltransferase family protein, partial [Enorma massiliensis]
MTVTPATPATPASPGTPTAPTPNASLAPLTERLAAGETYRPRTLDTLHIADKDLRLVLEGRRHLLFDGGMGTMLQAAGMAAGEVPELLNLTNPEVITRVHAAYVEAGSEVVTTNTFGANALKLGDAASVEDVFTAAVQAARAAHPRYVAADIGPIGALLRPLGTLSFDEAYALFAQQARVAEQAGADLIVIETMTDLLEVKAAVLAAKECTNLPVIATMTFE